MSATTVTYPRIISTAPCDQDLFKGHSHQLIASRIVSEIVEGKTKGIIGIDGEWGSGKSNLVGIVRKELSNKKNDDGSKRYVTVTYDAWAHQTDYLRRSFLEEFINELTNVEKVLDPKWNESIDILLARVKEIDTKQTVKLNEFVIGSALFSYISALLVLVFDKPQLWFILGGALVVFVVATAICRYRSMKKFHQDTGFWNVLSEMTKLYVDAANIENRTGYSEVNNKAKEFKTLERITEKEPTARQFRAWMKRIDDELGDGKHHVVLVIDNMDRLPIEKVHETWATIHAFFAETPYKHITTIVPFDRSHVANAFKQENIKKAGKKDEEISYGNDFINKTFYVVYRVSPPILSDWKNYFRDRWKEAFGNKIYTDTETVMLAFEKMSHDFTPRGILAFINEMVTVYTVMGKDVEAIYAAVYILGKSEINKETDKQLLKHDFIPANVLTNMNEEEIPRSLSAIHYQIEKKTAVDVVYQPKLTKMLDDGRTNIVKELGNEKVILSLLPSALGVVSNFNQVIDALEAIETALGEEGQQETGALWSILFMKLKNSSYVFMNYEEHHAKLLKHVPEKDDVVKYFLSKYLQIEEGWKVDEYVKGIDKFREIAVEAVDNYFQEHEKKAIESSLFETLLELTGERYQNYGLTYEGDKFDKYIAEKEGESISKIKYIPLIVSEKYPMPATKAKLVATAKSQSQILVLRNLVDRLREIQLGKDLAYSFTEAFGDSNIMTLRQNTSRDNETYYDLVAMRIARGKHMNSAHAAAFADDVKETDDSFVKKVADKLSYYVDYGDFLLSVKDFQEKELVTKIAQLLTNNATVLPNKIESKAQLLRRYDDITLHAGVAGKELLREVEKHDGTIDYNKELLQWPFILYEDCKGLDAEVLLAREINSHAIAYLKGIDTDGWKKHIQEKQLTINLWKLYQPLQMNLKDACSIMLRDYAEGKDKKPDKLWMTEILAPFSDAKYKKKEFFTDLYNIIRIEPTAEKVAYFTSWLFEEGIISSGEDVANLYKTELLDNDDVIKELMRYADMLSRFTLPEDVAEKLVQMSQGNRSGDEALKSFCEGNKQTKSILKKMMKEEEK